jgi:tellurite resistance-related uncharacterized protein
MIRSVVAFYTDLAGDWIAKLSCHHNQHVRHRPPFQERAWVLEPAGRAAHLGSAIDCPLCDRCEFPEGLTILRRVGPWDQDSLPGGLLGAHRVPDGQWGRLLVAAGAIGFQFEADEMLGAFQLPLVAGSQQAIPPGAPHRLIPIGAVRLEIEFWGDGALGVVQRDW